MSVALVGPAWSATTVVTTTSFDYDLTTGLLKKTVVEPGDSSLCLVTEYTPDTYGHPQTITTRNCNGSSASATGAVNEAAAPIGSAGFAARASSNVYSTDQRFAIGTVNALNQLEAKSYDGRFGTLTTLKDQNELTTTWAYDGLGRRTLETRPDQTQSKWTYVFCVYPGESPGSWPAPPTGALTSTCETVSASFRQGAYAVGPRDIRPVYYIQTTPLKPDGTTPNGSFARVYYDLLGHEIRTETQGFDGAGASQSIYQDVSYDRAGNVNAKSLQYTPGVSPVYSIVYDHDLLGRSIRQYEGDAAGGPATITTSYSGQRTTVTDAKGFRTIQTRDAAGFVTTITDAKDGTLQRAYDPLGNLVQTTDAKGNVISMVYDKRSRKTALFDPDLGAWSYQYNAAGEQVRQTDAKGQITTYSYDKLGRLVNRAEPDLSSSWFYDRYADGSACTKGIGQLCEATSDNGYRRKQVFDGLGRISSIATLLGSQTYTAGVTYDANTGRLNTQTYPTGLQINVSYTALGYPLAVTDARNGIALWTNQGQDAQGHVQQYVYGNGLVTNDAYFKDGRFKSTRAGSGNSVQNILLGYDANRNVNARMDLATGVTASYAHDELNRLISETRSGGGLVGQQIIGWGYDTIGNMTSRTEGAAVNTYNYNASGIGSARPHAVGSVSGAVNGVPAPTYQYDQNGNFTTGAGRTVAWTSFNMVGSVSTGGRQLNFNYGPEHDRIKETYSINGAAQRTTVYVHPSGGAGLFYEEESGNAGLRMKHFISAGGSTVAVITCTSMPCTGTANTTTQYWHADHLGSVTVVTNEAGTVAERMAYEPFGKRRNVNATTDANGTLVPSSTDRGYTEQEHMDEVGLINMNGRVYDPALSRFLSADPTIPYPNETQSYNRYSYGRNGPLRMVDPSGFEDVDFHDGICLICSIPTTGMPTTSGASAWSTFSTLGGNAAGFSSGISSDPLASFGGVLGRSSASSGDFDGVAAALPPQTAVNSPGGLFMQPTWREVATGVGIGGVVGVATGAIAGAGSFVLFVSSEFFSVGPISAYLSAPTVYNGAALATVAAAVEIGTNTVSPTTVASGARAAKAASSSGFVATKGTELVVWDGAYATRQLLGTTTTPGGRQINFHAADRMVNPPAGRAVMSPADVDKVLDGATAIQKRTFHPNGNTLTIQNWNMPGAPRVVVDEATGTRVITVINPKRP